MKHIVRQKVTVDEVTFYLAQNVELLPDLYDVFLEKLTELERQDKVCLIPLTILQRYNRRLKRAS